MSAQADPVRPVFGDPWELREFRMLADHQLHLVSTRQTPHDTRNGTVQLANYINANTAAILNGTYVLPTAWGGQPLLTGSALNATVADDAVWDAAGINDQEARHKFSLGTCSGCHGGETRNQPADLSFLHIAPRAPTTASALSRFLVGNGTLAAPGTFDKPDPINPLTIRPFGDLVHRRSDLAALSVASCGATGLLQEAMFQPMIDVH